MAKKNETITVQGLAITVTKHNKEDYASLTDMAAYKNSADPRFAVFNWMSTHYTLEFLAVWEQVNNPNFNRMGYHTVKSESGRLLVSVKKVTVHAPTVIPSLSRDPRLQGSRPQVAAPFSRSRPLARSKIPRRGSG